MTEAQIQELLKMYAAAPPAAPPAAAQLDAPSLDDGAVLDYSNKGPDFFAYVPFRSVLVLTALRHINGAKGPRYQADVTVESSDSTEARVGYKYSIPFKYYPGASPATKEGTKTRMALQDLRALCAAVQGADARDRNFKADAARAELMAASNAPGGLSLRFEYVQTTRVTDAGERTSRFFDVAP